MSWLCHFNVHTGNFHIKGYLMLHLLAGATMQVANLINYYITKRMTIKLIDLKIIIHHFLMIPQVIQKR